MKAPELPLPLLRSDQSAAKERAARADWKQYQPYTNVLWLWHLIRQLERQRRESKNAEELQRMRDWHEYGEPLYRRVGVRDHAAGIDAAAHVKPLMPKLKLVLDPTIRPWTGVRSATELVEMAVDEGWLTEDDVSSPDSRHEYESRHRPLEDKLVWTDED